MSEVLTISEKYCPGCETKKPTSNFTKSLTKKNGLQCYCKSCMTAQRKTRASTRVVFEKLCRSCGKVKAANQFHKNKSMIDGLGAVCSECFRWNQIKYKYKIDRNLYEVFIKVQRGVCAVCKRPSKTPLHVDHDHRTNAVRGLLCGPCNRAIGLLGEDCYRLESAISYLSGQPQRTAT